MSERPAGISDSWRKSSFSADAGCVQVRRRGDTVQMRDSKNPHGPLLQFTRREWDAFIAGVDSGEFSFPNDSDQPF